MRSGVGAESLHAWFPEEPGDTFNVGHPRPNVRNIPPPLTAPTTADGGAGNITGSVEYAQCFVTKGGFKTPVGPWSTPLSVTAKNVDVSALEAPVDLEIYASIVYRRVNGVVEGAVKKFWSPGAVGDFTDSLAVGSPFIDARDQPASLDETGKNAGMKAITPESADLKSDYSVIATKELTGTAGKVRGFPGGAKFDHTIKDVLSNGFAVPGMATLINAPTVYGVKADAFVLEGDGPWDEPTRKYVFTPSRAGLWTARSVGLFAYKGGQVPPEIFFNNMASEFDVAAKGGAVSDATMKLMGLWHTKTGFGTAALVAGDEYPTVPVLFGVRQDVNALTKAAVFQVTQALGANNYILVRCKNDPAGTYTALGEITVYVNTTSNKQTVDGSANPSDKVEIVDQFGLRFGADGLAVGIDPEMRRPVMILFASDLSLLKVGTEFTIPFQPLIPDLGTTPGLEDGTYTGFPLKQPITPRYGAAHLTLFRGASAADTPVLIDSCALKISCPKIVYSPMGLEADYGIDIDRNGEAVATLTFSRRFIDREFERYIERGQRIYASFVCEGERIPVTPGDPAVAGHFSTFRETFRVDGTSWAVPKKPTSPTNGPGVTEETITLEAEQPYDHTLPPFTATIITREDHVID